MSDMTPAKLRVVALIFKWPHDPGQTLDGHESAESYLDTCADAWAADRARLAAAERKPTVLEFGQGRVEVSNYSTDGLEGVIDGVAFRVSEVAHEMGESDPTVDGISMEEFGPCLKFHFTRASSVQVLIDKLAVTMADLAAQEIADG